MALVSDIGEFGLIDRLRTLDAVRGIGDDCAVIAPRIGHDLVMTADALVENVHFRHEWTSWRDLGYKSIAVNLSDIAAMGAQPLGVLITLALKADAPLRGILDFYAGAAEILKANGADIVGGDIVASPTATMVSVTAYGSVPTRTAARRGGAQPGDEIWVTGSLGDSAAGLRLLQQGITDFPSLIERHNRPTPRVEEAAALMAERTVHAMMDVSDGLGGDLAHLCDESGVGALIEEDALPLSPDLLAARDRFGWNAVDLALRGGEDYELLVCGPAPGADAAPLAFPLTRIGVIESTPGLRLQHADGTHIELEGKSFQHF